MSDPTGGRSRADKLLALYDELDWAATSLGPRSGWSETLQTAVDLALNTRFPITLLWGPDFTLVYNDAYTDIIGDLHPNALGKPCQAVFPDIWNVIGPMLEGVRDTKVPTWTENALLSLQRRGYDEESYFNFSYSVVTNPAGEVEGVIDLTAETTNQVVDRRRIVLLARLGGLLNGMTSAQDVCDAALSLLAAGQEDIAGIEIRLPGVPTACGGRPLPSMPESLPLAPRLVRNDDGVAAWSRLPVAEAESGGASVLGVLLSPRLEADEAYLDFVRLVGVALAQALDRIAAAEADARLVTVQRELSVSMQQSLLSDPVAPDHLEVAVRYRPAMQQVQIGGDWYDSFLLPDGTLTLTVGDVSGHDRAAAAAMAQVRNLLRGIAFTQYGPPARILTGLNDAMRGLAVGSFATAIVAQIEQAAADEAAGLRTLRWSNAGHPPPVLVDADGVRLLDEPTDLMLGVRGHATRADHTVTLQPGSTLVFYTDGLIERRGVPFDQSLDAVREAVAGFGELSAQQLCDALLEHFCGPQVYNDDDIVLLVLRAHSEARPRPAEAGPEVLPADLRAPAV